MVAWSNSQEMSDANEAMLVKFLKALDIVGVKLKNFMLQTGGKHYGRHHGPPMKPQFESDPRIDSEPNFYYAQEDQLFEYCQRTGSSWTVVRPSTILGAVSDALLNFLYGLAVYASVQAHLNKPLRFPANLAAWEAEYVQSSAMMNAYLEEWSALEPKCKNQAFNASDGSHFTYARLWPFVARWFGTNGYATPELDESKYNADPLALETPSRGFGPQSALKCTFLFCEWAKDPRVQTAWDELAKKHNLASNPFDKTDQTFGLTDMLIRFDWGIQMGTTKARRLGWNGFCDSIESTFSVFQELAEFRLTPPMKEKDWGAPY